MVAIWSGGTFSSRDKVVTTAPLLACGWVTYQHGAGPYWPRTARVGVTMGATAKTAAFFVRIEAAPNTTPDHETRATASIAPLTIA
jgi:hypothetical protein